MLEINSFFSSLKKKKSDKVKKKNGRKKEGRKEGKEMSKGETGIM